MFDRNSNRNVGRQFKLGLRRPDLALLSTVRMNEHEGNESISLLQIFTKYKQNLICLIADKKLKI